MFTLSYWFWRRN